MNEAKRIASRDNATFKALRALSAEPHRHGRTLVDGIHLVATCRARGHPVRQLLASESGLRQAEVAALFADADGIERLVLRDALFREVSGVLTPTGIAAVIEIPPEPAGAIEGDALLLDAVQDAGNVGAMLRTAAAAGLRNVLLGPGCAGAWTPRVLRGGQGAHFSLAIREKVDLGEVLATARATAVATVARGGIDLYRADLRGPTWWLVGNEGAGLSAALVEAAALRVTIPLAGGTESLNVAAATAVCLFEARRQRSAPLAAG